MELVRELVRELVKELVKSVKSLLNTQVSALSFCLPRVKIARAKNQSVLWFCGTSGRVSKEKRN